MAKKKATRPKLNRKDLIGISKLAKLSTSTLVKWHEGSLNVKPETELKIFDATDRFYEQETLRLKENLQKLTEIEQRIVARKVSVRLALKAMKASDVKKKAE